MGADCLKTISNAEKRGKRQVLVRPSSKVVVKFLQCMQQHGYIGEFEIVDDHRGGKIVVELTGRLNKCGVILHDLMPKKTRLNSGLPIFCLLVNSVMSFLQQPLES